MHPDDSYLKLDPDAGKVMYEATPEEIHDAEIRSRFDRRYRIERQRFMERFVKESESRENDGSLESRIKWLDDHMAAAVLIRREVWPHRR